MRKSRKFISHHQLRVRGVKYEPSSINTLRRYPSEKFEHFRVKSMLFYILSADMGHKVLTEFEISGYGIGDLMDLSTRTPTQYEIEQKPLGKKHVAKFKTYARKGLEIIMVYINQLPKDEYERYEYLKDKIIVPD